MCLVFFKDTVWILEPLGQAIRLTLFSKRIKNQTFAYQKTTICPIVFYSLFVFGFIHHVVSDARRLKKFGVPYASSKGWAETALPGWNRVN